MVEVNESRDAGTPAPSQPESAGSGIKSWITGVFMDPGATFQSIADTVERPHPTDPSKTKDMSKWWLPVLITVVVGIGIALYTIPAFVAPMVEDGIREAMMERGGTEADVQQALPMVLIGLRVVAVVFPLIVFFIAAGLAHLFMRMVGGKGRFRHARAVVAWSMLITTLGELFKLPMMIARNTMRIEMGPSLFFKGLEPSERLFKFLSGFDIFILWWMIVMVVALAVTYRTSRGKAAVAVALLWILLILFLTFAQGGPGGGM
jgi:hypothetical protein